MLNPLLHRLSETAWLISFGTGIDVRANAQVHQLAKWIRLQSLPGLIEVIPAYDSLLLQFSLDSSPTLSAQQFHEWVSNRVHAGISALEDNTAQEEPALLHVPVCYDLDLGNDLMFMSEQSGMTMDEIVAIHAGTVYQVFMLGFLPGFAYMGKVDPRIALPRKPTPAQVRPGAVGIAAEQTGIYPLSSPGGWNIVGYTPLHLFDARSEKAALFEPGMRVKFDPISLEEFKKYSNP